MKFVGINRNLNFVRFYSQSIRETIYNHHRDNSKEKHVDWFRTSHLADLRNNPKEPLLVFLEGSPAVGKRDVLSRLEKIGFQVSRNNFLDKFQSISKIEEAEQQRVEHLKQFITTCKESVNQGNFFKENVIFYNRSLLSCWKYESAPQDAKDQIGSIWPNYAIVLCISDPIVRAQRLAYAHYLASPEEMEKRKFLKETDDEYLEHLTNVHTQYLSSKIFDDFIHTTSVKQGAAAVLSLLGIKPSLFS